MDSDSPDFIDDIIADKLPAHIDFQRDKFLPWHRVRKQYIRHFQWNSLAVRMIQRYWQRELNQKESEWSLGENAKEIKIKIPPTVLLDKPLRCLVIPGDDLLDLRSLWLELVPLNCFIRYLGFNESSGSQQIGTRVHIANNALTSLARVATDSQVIQDRFEAIAHRNSQAYHQLKKYGPYHIVNLDFCGSLMPTNIKDPPAYHEALHRLLTYQFAEQKSEWLLFITTEIEPSAVHPEKFQKLCKPTGSNFKSHRDFAERIEKILPKEAFENSLVDLSKVSESQMITLFGVAFGKWLLHLCHQASPQWTIAMRRSFRYSINKNKNAVMLALAFELKPNVTPPADTTGLSKLAIATKKFPTECECGIKLVESVAAIRDVDAELASDPKLKSKLRDDQADLLQASGYDRAAYISWVKNGEIISKS